MPRIRLTAHPLNAPRASRSGGRRTLRDHRESLELPGRARRDMGNRGRSLPPGWWIGAAVPFALAFWTGVAWIMWMVL